MTDADADADAITLAVMQSLLRFVHTRLRGLFPYLPAQPGYRKRLRKLAATMVWVSGKLPGAVSVAADDVWVADSTPVECGRGRETAHRSDLAG